MNLRDWPDRDTKLDSLHTAGMRLLDVLHPRTKEYVGYFLSQITLSSATGFMYPNAVRVFKDWANMVDDRSLPGWLDNGYHNPGHCLRVANRAVTFACDLGLPVGDIDVIACAALWHDFGYVPCKEGDRRNVPVAVAAWRTYAYMKGLDKGFIRTVANAIESTLYPYPENVVFSASNPIHVCLRDADLTEILDAENYELASHGLCMEMTASGVFTGDQSAFLAGNINFISNMHHLVSEYLRPHVIRAVNAYILKHTKAT